MAALTHPFDKFLFESFVKDISLAVELGTYTGNTSIDLSMKVKRLVTIDLFEDVHLIKNKNQRRVYTGMFENSKHSFEKIREKLSEYKNIEVRKSLSCDEKAAVDILDDSVDFLFMDADHSCEGLIKEWELWYPKVVKGAYIIVHDTFPFKESNASARAFILAVDKAEAEVVCMGGYSTLLRKV